MAGSPALAILKRKLRFANGSVIGITRAEQHTMYPPSIYSIDASIDGVEKAIITPWFSQKGLGVQYKLPSSVQYYLDNLILGEPK